VAAAARNVADYLFAKFFYMAVPAGARGSNRAKRGPSDSPRSKFEPLESRRMLDALPAWVDPSSVATWSASTNTLLATGEATIIADPGTAGTASEPIIIANGPDAVVTFDTTGAAGSAIHIGGLSLTDFASAIVAHPSGGGTEPNQRVLVIGSYGPVTRSQCHHRFQQHAGPG